MIPKVIHYIWLGKKKKPKEVVDQINQWKNKLPEYQIKEWNESNYDISKISSKYVHQAIENQMWAFVSDYIRLDILNREGGIYLDTDVEIVKSFDVFLKNDAFIGFESKYAFSTAVIGSMPNQEWLENLIRDYSDRIFLNGEKSFDLTPNSKYIYNYFVEKYNFVRMSGIQQINGVMIYPSTYFSPINFATQKNDQSADTVTIHHYSGTWKSNRGKLKDFIIIVLTKMLGENIVEVIKKIAKSYKKIF